MCACVCVGVGVCVRVSLKNECVSNGNFQSLLYIESLSGKD